MKAIIIIVTLLTLTGCYGGKCPDEPIGIRCALW